MPWGRNFAVLFEYQPEAQLARDRGAGQVGLIHMNLNPLNAQRQGECGIGQGTGGGWGVATTRSIRANPITELQLIWTYPSVKTGTAHEFVTGDIPKHVLPLTIGLERRDERPSVTPTRARRSLQS
jgi:hypothetical protein